ncbi:MAG: hypothetical protein JO368_03210 [Acidimicrobiales bacterium]|nr:hypothetical protein [Acidimicrobiales bacterium]
MRETRGWWGRLALAVRDSDDDRVEAALVGLSRRNRLLAPLGLLVGGFIALFQGVRLLVTNWRLTLIQLLPAVLVWGAMFDFKVHVFRGKSFNVIRGPVLIPIILAIASLTAAAYLLNAIFAFAVSGRGTDSWRAAWGEARAHLRVILGWGFGIGLALGFATTVSSRWGHGWFALCLGIVVAVMMVTYVTVPAALVGIRTKRSRREQITTGAVSGAVSAVICSPPYALGRAGIILLGTSKFFVVGIVMLIVAVPLQAGAVTATKAVKFSSKLLAGSYASEPPAVTELEDEPVGGD